jgi:hypothetical protein
MLKGQMLTLRQRVRRSMKGAFSAAPIYSALLIATVLSLVFARAAHATITVLVGEPFGTFGTYIPVGHATIYLDRVCADGPLKLRMCQPGEPAGVAISRYDHIGDYDWLATPILQFLYAADRPEDTLQYATPELVDSLRRQYRHRVLNTLFPDGTETASRNNEWWESVGMAYIRRYWGYQLATTRAQDERFVAAINARPNQHIYGAYHANCANFAADVVTFYYPGIVKKNRLADLGALLPTQLARSVYIYGRDHPEAELKVVEIPQVNGSIRRSHAVRGGAESFLKTKRYVFPLSILQPEITVTLFGLYLDHGGWKIARPASILGPETVQPAAQHFSLETSPSSPSARARYPPTTPRRSVF